MTNLEWLYRHFKRFRNYVAEEVWTGDWDKYGVEFDSHKEVVRWLLEDHDEDIAELNMRGPW